jgi:hypothetical protein
VVEMQVGHESGAPEPVFDAAAADIGGHGGKTGTKVEQ